jgi:hypothetical protein
MLNEQIKKCIKFLEAYRLTNEGYLDEEVEKELQQTIEDMYTLQDMIPTLSECVGYSLHQIIYNDIQISTNNDEVVKLYEIMRPNLWKLYRKDIDKINKD